MSTDQTQNIEEGPTWEQMAMDELEYRGRPRVRVSNSGECERAMVYIAQGLEPSDPPDEHARNRMALGHMAEALIVKDLHAKGWETAHTRIQGRQLQIETTVPGTEYRLRGRPDGICRHPEYTKNYWVTLECKSMSTEMALRVEAQGIAQVYPKYMSQIAIYGRKLFEDGLVCNPHRGVFATMDRDGRPMAPERIAWSEDVERKTMEAIRLALERADLDELPERPYPPDSFECRFCSYHTMCRGAKAVWDEPDEGILSRRTTDPDVLEAARIWLETSDEQKRIKRVLQNASDDEGKVDIIAGGVTAGYFQPNRPPLYDPGLLQKKVPAEVLRECLAPHQDKREGFWVRATR